MMAIYGMFVFMFFCVVALVAGGIIVFNLSLALDRLAERVEAINRSWMFHAGEAVPLDRNLYPTEMNGFAGDADRQRAWEESNRQHFAMCGACGKSAPLKSDLFTLEEHDCDFNPDFMKDTLHA